MRRTRFVPLLVIALFGSTCGGNGSGQQSMLPGSNTVDSWTLTKDPIQVKTEADFYNMIDGGAPKFIERGWVSSVYAEYRKGDQSLQVAVHDMGTPQNAEAIFNTYLPAARTEISYMSESDPEGRRPNAVVDLNLSGTYVSHSFGKRYYIETNIDSKTEASLADLKAFVLETLDRTL
jgi:hypothetical protein